MTGKEFIKKLKKVGWRVDRITGSHHIMKKEGQTVTIPVHGTKDIPKGTLSKLLKEAGLK